MSNEITADRLVSAYIKIRNARSVLLQKFDAEDAELKMQMKLVTDKLHEICKETGVSGFKTPHGTVARVVKTRYGTNDWDSMYQFIKEHDAFHLLEQRIAQKNMQTFLDEHPDTLPMGLNSNSEYSIRVTKR